MSGRQADPDRLRNPAEKIHEIGETFRISADDLSGSLQQSSDTADPSADIQSVVGAVRETAAQLSHHANLLAALAAAYLSLDDEAIESFLQRRGEEAFIRRFLPAASYPQIDELEPYFLPRLRMVQSEWTPVYVLDSQRLRQTNTFHTGRILRNAIGTWSNPETQTAYCVALVDDGTTLYLPEGTLSPPIDAARIPNREGVWDEGQRGPVSDPWQSAMEDGAEANWRNPGDPWQYFILGRMSITGLRGAVFPSVPHANLCGELSVLSAVGEKDLVAGFSRFAQLTGLGYWNIDGGKTEYSGTQVLQNVGHTTSSYDLKRLFEAYGWACRIHGGTMPLPDEWAEFLRSGGKVVFLTELDARKKAHSSKDGAWIDNPEYGRLVSGAQPHAAGLAAHWVSVVDVFQDGRGSIRVRVWNTYSGCDETYSWERISRSGKNPGTSAGSYTFLEAVPPDA
jgi:hypothetical protein